jgi:hypothetical protein
MVHAVGEKGLIAPLSAWPVQFAQFIGAVRGKVAGFRASSAWHRIAGR